ncbi:MAG: pyridoxal phosphate-dependent aminotransferase [Methanomicrobiales archaeon]|nr:pyridoxal phosphate-dependent aminotransferase [Methanomicrobiales archaeon]
MNRLSEKIAAIAPSATIEISDEAQRMKREGIDVISLSIGEPDFATPGHITEACIDALRRGETHYAPSAGIPELRKAIAAKISRENGFPADENNTIVSCGAKNTIYEAMEAVLDPGDEVLICDPCWVSYEPCVQIAGGRAVHHPLPEPAFQVDDTLLERVSRKTKMIVVNSPSNPSGAVLNDASLRCVADICTDHDIVALSDEIYEKLVYGVEHRSLAAIGDMHERTITVNGFSKAYAMTGWRIGYAVAPLPIIRQMIKVQQHTISHPATFAMWGAVAALEGDQSCVDAMRDAFDERRRFVMAALSRMGFATAPADGAFYAFLRTGDDMNVARRWLHEARVAVTPGTAFSAPGWIRLSYAADIETLRRAMERIAQVL